MSKAEKFIKDCTRNCSNEIGYCHNKTRNHNHVFYDWLTPDQARRAVEIAREETINEVCEWIKYNNENGGCSFDGWENDLKKHLNSKL